MLRLCACMPCFSNGLQVMLISKYQFSKVLSLFEKGLFCFGSVWYQFAKTANLNTNHTGETRGFVWYQFYEK